MFHGILLASSLLALASQAFAQAPIYGQCDYSQCIPGAASEPASTAPVATITPTPVPPSPTVTVPQGPTTTASGATPTGSQIRADQPPVYHFYLQSDGTKPVLGPEASSGYFTIGSTISLDGADGSKLYLNVDESAATSYKPLTFDAVASTTDWGLEGDTIIATAPRQLNFLACSTSDADVYDVFFQEGNDMPAGTSCTLVTLHLPCLC
ncbi:hypothetical protein TRAPUB_8925 [Trametes pubescens]|uniref:Uncharacterized protein n=1 Tax=Trametes pubescens TaxID=154538 RepID=A0A1M2W435_TRAPU|nr:hypothetical protein TRAPUB_8925 [Trametes pubescens]